MRDRPAARVRRAHQPARRVVGVLGVPLVGVVGAGPAAPRVVVEAPFVAVVVTDGGEVACLRVRVAGGGVGARRLVRVVLTQLGGLPARVGVGRRGRVARGRRHRDVVAAVLRPRLGLLLVERLQLGQHLAPGAVVLGDGLAGNERVVLGREQRAAGRARHVIGRVGAGHQAAGVVVGVGDHPAAAPGGFLGLAGPQEAVVEGVGGDVVAVGPHGLGRHVGRAVGTDDVGVARVRALVRRR